MGDHTNLDVSGTKVDVLEVVMHFHKTQCHKREYLGHTLEIMSRPVELLSELYPDIGAAILKRAWYQCTIRQELFRSLKALPPPFAQRWYDLSNGSLMISDVAEKLRKGPLHDGEKETKEKILELIKALIEDSVDRRIVIARKFNGHEYVLLDGNSRAVAMAYLLDRETFEPFDAYLGY